MVTCLCVIFNHAFPKNIDILKRVYQDRFTYIRFIQPLVRSDDPDVITAYRGSYAHGAYVTDALQQLMALDAERYVFIQDDVLLSPSVDESNLGGVLGIDASGAFITNFVNSDSEDLGAWGYWPGTIWRLLSPRNLLSGTGVQGWESVKAALPPQPEALSRIKPFGLGPKTLLRTSRSLDFPMRDVEIFPGEVREENVAFYEETFRRLVPSGEVTLDYPLVNAGPSADFYVLPRSELSEFAHICGVLSAAGAFVEVAIGTAIALAARDLRLARHTGVRLRWADRNLDVAEVLRDMQSDATLVAAHPVKLSGQQESLIDLVTQETFPVPEGAARSYLERALKLAPEFDGAAYLRANKDVEEAGADAAFHYVTHGWAERRSLGVPSK